MFKINGEYIMQSCDPSDPNCIHSINDLVQLIKQIGFIPLFASIVPGFSVEERTTAEAWAGKDSPWEWREILAANPDIAYGQFFDGKTGFIHRSWFPTFANYRRNGCDFEDLYYNGKASHDCKKVMDQVRGRIISNGDLKRQTGISNNYNAALRLLQMQTYLIAVDFEKKISKRGQITGSWHEAILSTPETKWDYDFVTAEYGDDPSTSWRKIKEQLQLFFPAVDDKIAFKLLGITVCDIAIGKPVKEKEQKMVLLRTYQLPWPESIITEIGLKTVLGTEEYMPLSDDQINGLDHALNTLLPREKDVVLRRYRDHQSLTQIGKHYDRSLERMRQINAKAIRKLRNPSRLKLYQAGLQKIEERAEILKTNIMEIRRENELKGLEPLDGIGIEEMNLSVRAYNCLKRSCITRISDIERIISTEPEKLKEIRSLGKNSAVEIIKNAERFGIDTKLARQIYDMDN